MVKTSIIPASDIIICIDPPEDVTEQGVILSQDLEEDKKRKPEKGIVVAIGPNSDPKRKLPEGLAVGDLIFYERYTSNKIPDSGNEYNFVRAQYLMGFKKI